MIEFGILGPLMVREDVGQVEIAGARRRTLLIRLLASANDSVPADRLAEDLWDGAPPAGAKSTLSSHISLLRGLIGSDRIWSRDGGYVLKAAEAEIDARSFEIEAQRGGEALRNREFRPAAVLLDHALSRWRGEAMVDVAGAFWAAPEIVRLEELRLATFNAWIEARLALGEHSDVVPFVEAAVAEHPLQERLSALLMLALYRGGRQADALRVYQRLRSALDAELGIVPSSEVVALEEAILLQQPELDWSGGSTAGDLVGASRGAGTSVIPDSRSDAIDSHGDLIVSTGGTPRPEPESSLSSDLRWIVPLDDLIFVDRGPELELLHSEWKETVFRPRLVVIEGNAGVGKTRLVGEAARGIDAEGGMVLFGRCDEGAIRPCRPIGEALDYLASVLSDDDFDELVASHAHALACLSGTIARRSGIDQPALSLHAEADRYRLLEAVGNVMAGVGARRALFFVMDDLQWADPLTLIVMRHLLSRLEPTPVTIVATARDEEPEYRRTVTRLMNRLDRTVSAKRMPISGLAVGDVEALVRHHQPTVDVPSLIGDLWRVTLGNPFFVLQVALQLGENSASSQLTANRTPTEFQLPDRVRELIDIRLGELSDDASSLVTVGSVFGEQFVLDDVAAIADLDDTRALTAAEELLARRFVAPLEGDTYRFDHVLVQRTVYESLTPSRRLRLHRRAGECLVARGVDHATERVGEVAYHFTQAAALGPRDVEIAASWARVAGDQDFAQLAFESAAAQYSLALSLLESLPASDVIESAELSTRVGESLNAAGQTERGKQALLRAFEMGRKAQRVDLKVGAALLYGGSLPLATNVDDRHPADMLEEVLGESDRFDASTRARCLSRLALWKYRTDTRSDRQFLCDEALDLVRDRADPRALADVLHDRSWALSGPDGCHDQLAAGSELVSIGEELGDSTLILHGQQARLHGLLELGPAAEARTTSETVASLAHELRHPAHLWSSTMHLALRLAAEGRFLEAADLSDTALRLHRPSDEVQAVIGHGTQRFQRHWLEGRLEEDRELLESALAGSPDRLSMTAAVLWIEVETGRRKEARILFDRMAEVGWSSVPKDLEWWPIMVSAVLAARALADQSHAKALYEHVLPYQAHNCVAAGVAFFGNAEHLLGIAADTIGEREVAERHLRAAALRYDEWDAFPFGALCRNDLAQVLLKGGESAKAECLRLRSQSSLDANRLGMANLAAQIESLEGGSRVAS